MTLQAKVASVNKNNLISENQYTLRTPSTKTENECSNPVEQKK